MGARSSAQDPPSPHAGLRAALLVPVGGSSTGLCGPSSGGGRAGPAGLGRAASRRSGRCRLRSRRPGRESRDGVPGRPRDILSRRTRAPPTERRLAPFRPGAGRLGLGGRAGCVLVWPCSAARARRSRPPGRGPAQGLQDWPPGVDLTAPCSRLKC